MLIATHRIILNYPLYPEIGNDLITPLFANKVRPFRTSIAQCYKGNQEFRKIVNLFFSLEDQLIFLSKKRVRYNSLKRVVTFCCVKVLYEL